MFFLNCNTKPILLLFIIIQLWLANDKKNLKLKDFLKEK